MKSNYILYGLMLLGMFARGIDVKGQEGDWKHLGPTNMPLNYQGGTIGIGRATQIKFHPSDPNMVYAITASGGLAISRDGGRHWKAGYTDQFSKTHFASVCVDHTDDRILYVGTGDANHYFKGIGIYRSMDEGMTWDSLQGVGNRTIVEILMSPFDHNELIVATNDGILKSKDQGQTWEVKKTGGEFTQMVFKPGGKSSVIYAVTYNQFFRSLDMGETWSLVDLPGAGLEKGGRIGVSKADSNVVFLSFVGDPRTMPPTCTPVLKSIDGGASFTVVKSAGFPNLNGMFYENDMKGQGNYDFVLAVDAMDINTLYAGGHMMYRSDDGGVTWVKISGYDQRLHTDHHQLIFSPYDDTKLFCAHDGGISVSTDRAINWAYWSDGLSGTESGNAVQNPVIKSMVHMGTQDNGEIGFFNGFWAYVGGGDSHQKMEFGYTKTPYRYDLTGYRKLLPRGGDEKLNLPITFPEVDRDGNAKDVQMVFTPQDTNVAYMAQWEIHRTKNMSSNPEWTPLTHLNNPEVFIKDLAVSHKDANIVYGITNNKKIIRIENALAENPKDSLLDAPASTNVAACIEVIKSNPNVIYVSCNKKVYRSSKKGEKNSWTNVTYNLPDVNIIELIHDEYKNDESIYLATQLGVYYKNKNMNTWVNYSKGLPKSSYVNRMMIYNDSTSNSELRVGTDGRGVFTTALYGNPAVMREPDKISGSVSGLRRSYYKGSWDHLPHFQSLIADTTTLVAKFDITDKAAAEDNFGFLFKGYINIPADGSYTFYLKSDDGSRLYIGDELVVDNDGLHGEEDEVSGSIGLKKGKHAIAVHYFENSVDNSLVVSFKGPSIAKQEISASYLYTFTEGLTYPGTGFITREQWKNVTGPTIPVNETPDVTDQLTEFGINFNQGSYYGERVRGYIVPPYTGSYTFYIAGDESYELWLSSNDNPDSITKIVYGTQNSGVTGWNVNSSQQKSVTLQAGQKYYIEMLHKETTGEDFFGVAWKLPNGTFEGPIPGSRILPFKGKENYPRLSFLWPLNNTGIVADSSLKLIATAYDLDGTIAKVEFFRDGVYLGADTSYPYSWQINSLAAGNYKFSAKATDNDNKTTDSYLVNVLSSTLRNPDNPVSPLKGVDYKLYNNYYSSLPVASYYTPSETGGRSDVTLLTQKDGQSNFAYVFTGFIDIPTDGFYTFYTYADDRGLFYIGNDLVIDNTSDIQEKQSKLIGLKAGKHAFRLEMKQDGGEYNSYLSYSGPGISKQLIPASAFYRPGTSPNMLPEVKITNVPASITGSRITLSADASDYDGTVSKVQFQIDGTTVGEDIAAPYTYDWSAPATAGTYTLTVKAIDDKNGTTTANVPFKIVEALNPENPLYVDHGLNYRYYEDSYDSIPENLTSLDYTKADTINDVTLSIPGRREDDFYLNFTGYLDVPFDGIYYFSLSSDDGSEFYIGNSKIVDNDPAKNGTSRKIGDPVGLKAGKHAVTINFHEGGDKEVLYLYYQGPGVPYPRVVPASLWYRPGSNQAPAVSITSPVNNATVNVTNAVLNASASDDGQISKVEFYNGTEKIGESVSAPYSFTWTDAVPGTYTITARAYDNKGVRTASAPVTITVTDGTQPPVVNMIYPANNTSYPAPAYINLEARATDDEGVSLVEYYANDVYIGQVSGPSFIYDWNDVVAGTYSVKAVAYDVRGISAESAPITIVVNATQTQTGDVFGPSCATKNQAIQLQLNPVNANNVTSYHWWTNTSGATSTGSSVWNVNTGANFSGGQFCIDVNYSVAPYYKQYCKQITLCPAREGAVTTADASASSLTIAPNPSNDVFAITLKKPAISLAVSDQAGNLVYSVSEIEAGKTIQFGRGFNDGVYHVTVVYVDNSKETLKAVKSR